MRRNLLVSSLLVMAAAAVGAETRTLPAAASIVGGAPFFSDVRAFNTSYTSALNVTATYRCFIGNPCPAVAPQSVFTLAPRQAQAFNDMVASTFLAPNTAGGVEFTHSGSSDQLVVTSRLYSTVPQPTVGMFIPGLENSAAHALTVLTSIRNLGPGDGFRTNVGVFNREDSAVSVTFSIFSATGAPIGGPVTAPVAAHAGVQISRIFEAAGAGLTATDNAVIKVVATGEVFSYAAVIDNATTDPIFVVGAEDRVPAAGPGPATRIVRVGMGGTNFVDDVGGGQLSTINVGDTVRWIWSGSGTTEHGIAAGTCSGGGGYYGSGESCTPSGLFDSGDKIEPFEFSHTFTTAGTYRYFCTIHGGAMVGRVIVTAP
jgi:plastocyanin